MSNEPLSLKSIAQWQDWMQNALLNPQGTQQSTVESTFMPGANLSPAESLAIYQRGYILRLTKCLADQFPALCHALGEQLFTKFAKRYLHTYPSQSYTLYDLGTRFAAFLEEDRPDKNNKQKETWIDFMVDLARYENLHFSLFDAPGHEGKPWPAADTPDESLKLQPCFALNQSRFPVGWYYHACKEKPDCPFPPQQTSWVALVRTNFFVTTFPINQVHFLFLQQVQKHNDIAKGLQHISKLTNTALPQVTQSWQNEVKSRWIDAGFFVAK